MKKTGIFFLHLLGERLRDFPQALEGLLDKRDVYFYEAFYELEPVSEELILKVHSPEMLAQVKQTLYYETACFSANGVVRAAELILSDELDNAFVFTGTGDHHAGRDYFGGGCYLNGTALAIQRVRDVFGAGRFAILDTDSHHGDGTRDIFEHDENVLHVCLCSRSLDQGTKVDVQIPSVITDGEYLKKMEAEFLPRVRKFRPELIFWEFGYDGTRGDYGSRGLSPDLHIRLAQQVKRAADDLCRGRLVVILCGGSRRDIARYCIPRIIRHLAELD